MLSFACDYGEGCHEKILQALADSNLEQLPGYGADVYSERAKEKIRLACECPDASVYLLSGGTQTNQIVIDAMLEPYEGVIAADTGHINTHEAGAIEYTGHKVLTLPQDQGKISSDQPCDLFETFRNDANYEHEVFPGMLYISYPTEYGTLYTADELLEISSLCGEYGIPLYIDGARLGYGLESYESDMTLANIAELADVFYIGGTKVGALCGEALVFPQGGEPSHFMTRIKQHGALMAKGRLLGVQFDTLFTDDLYLTISKNAIDRAQELKQVLHDAGITFYLETPTNQQFVILDSDQMQDLSEKVAFDFWQTLDETHTVVRFATSWATTPEQIEELSRILNAQGGI